MSEILHDYKVWATALIWTAAIIGREGFGAGILVYCMAFSSTIMFWRN